MSLRRLTLIEDEPGVWRIEGSLVTIWVLETDRLAGPDEPALAVLSRTFLRNPQLIMEMVQDPEAQPVLWYVFQQIRQFQRMGEAFMVQHTHTAEMDQEFAAIKEAFIASLTPEERLRGLSSDDPEYAAFKEALIESLTPEDLAGLSPEDRLAGLSPDDLLNALSVEDQRRLAERLRQRGMIPSEE
ncbi:MAG TPA: hypothetical protein VML55_12585 [Planctomycetaceae bacterium]|nr:hypothetical protein [Planctomycetaceae bacterium]